MALSVLVRFWNASLPASTGDIYAGSSVSQVAIAFDASHFCSVISLKKAPPESRREEIPGLPNITVAAKSGLRWITPMMSVPSPTKFFTSTALPHAVPTALPA